MLYPDKAPGKADCRLFCIGNAMIDVFAEVPLDFCKQFSLNVPVQHINAETAAAIFAALPLDKTLKSGGGAANTAKAAVRLGIKSAFAGALGSMENQCDSLGFDPLGVFFIQEMETAGVVLYLTKKKAPSGLFICITAANNKYILAAPSAALEFDAPDIEDLMFAGPNNISDNFSRVLYLDGFILDRKELVQHFIKMAGKFNLTLALDLGTETIALQQAQLIFGNKQSILKKAFLPGPLIVFMNKKEAEACAKVLNADWESLFTAESRNNSILITVKLAEQGAIVFSGGKMYKIPAKTLELPDSTGAGDAFAAGFLSAYLQNKSPEQCGLAGNSAAAMVLKTP